MNQVSAVAASGNFHQIRLITIQIFLEECQEHE
jgi:hypothetical protein